MPSSNAALLVSLLLFEHETIVRGVTTGMSKEELMTKSEALGIRDKAMSAPRNNIDPRYDGWSGMNPELLGNSLVFKKKQHFLLTDTPDELISGRKTALACHAWAHSDNFCRCEDLPGTNAFVEPTDYLFRCLWVNWGAVLA